MTVPTLSIGGAATGRDGAAGTVGYVPGLRTAARACSGISVRPVATVTPATIMATTSAASTTRATPMSARRAGARGTLTPPTRGTGTSGRGAIP